jgi:hypothetical protein
MRETDVEVILQRAKELGLAAVLILHCRLTGAIRFIARGGGPGPSSVRQRAAHG